MKKNRIIMKENKNRLAMNHPKLYTKHWKIGLHQISQLRAIKSIKIQ